MPSTRPSVTVGVAVELFGSWHGQEVASLIRQLNQLVNGHGKLLCTRKVVKPPILIPAPMLSSAQYKLPKENQPFKTPKIISRQPRNREQCPLAAREKKVLTETERARAEKLLADPKLLDYVLAFGRKRILGEDAILIQNFVF